MLSCSRRAGQRQFARTTLRAPLSATFRYLASIAGGPRQPPLLRHAIPQHFHEVVQRYGDRTAVISHRQVRRLTYSELDEASNKLASGLAEQNVCKGDRIAVSLGNGIEFATITYAVFKLGAILVPLNPGFNATQIVSALNHLAASHLVTGVETNLPFRPPRDNRLLLQKVIGGPLVHEISSPNIPSLRRVILVDNSIQGRKDSSTFGYEEISRGNGTSFEARILHAEDVVNIQFTSGTTSAPKAVCLTHTNILNNGQSIGDRMGLTERDVVCCPPPLFHCFGSVLGYMAAATHGSAILFPSEAFDPLATLQSVDEHRATALYGVPTMFLSELELLQSGKYAPQAWAAGRSGPAFPTLRTGIAAGTSVPIELMRRLHRDLNLTDLTICYGMTETSPVSLQTTTKDSLDRRVSTVGKPLPHVDVKIVDPLDWDRTLPMGEKGELAVGGYLVMKEYWGDPQRTADTMQVDDKGRKWMMTGDEASMDDEGYVRITGRIKDLIIRGGENIHPLEIENCLLAHPSVSDASVIGVPDERYGEAVAAFIIPSPDFTPSKDELQAHVREQLSSHLVPRYIWFVSELPKTESGKIKKYELRDSAKAALQESSVIKRPPEPRVLS